MSNDMLLTVCSGFAEHTFVVCLFIAKLLASSPYVRAKMFVLQLPKFFLCIWHRIFQLIYVIY